MITEQTEEKLIHLPHNEDHIIHSGMDGFAHAFHNLEDVHDQLHGKKNKTLVTTKYDGSPSLVFGHNPDNGQFFVASKSAFNKNPKLNYTFEDIEENHAHAPGLVQKLKTALEHLPKIAPNTGIYQGDVLHSGVQSKSNPEGDVKKVGSKYHFQANPSGIEYATGMDSDEGKKIKNSKFGIAVHTSYTGKNFAGLKVQHGADLSKFKDHKDVHLVDSSIDTSKLNMTPDQHETYQHHMKQATDVFKRTDKKAYDTLPRHVDNLSTYINKTVKQQAKPSVKGYLEHLKDVHTKAILKVKTEKAIRAKTDKMHEDLQHVSDNEHHFKNVFDMHYHIQRAKDQLVHALSSKPKFENYRDGIKVKPEGYVVVRSDKATKLVDRDEFSRQNLLGRPRASSNPNI